jgi:hypothetical protein
MANQASGIGGQHVFGLPITYQTDRHGPGSTASGIWGSHDSARLKTTGPDEMKDGNGNSSLNKCFGRFLTMAKIQNLP